MLRVWLPPPREDQTTADLVHSFLDQISSQLANASLKTMDTLTATSLRHFAFQDDDKRLVDPNAEVLHRHADTVLAQTEAYFAEADMSCKEAAEACADDDLLADLKPYLDEHTDSTITFLVTVTCGDRLATDTARAMGTALIHHLDGMDQPDDPPLRQLSLYKCVGYADYLLMGRVMQGKDFHKLYAELISPINQLAPKGAERDVRTITHLVGQRGLLVAEERLTGLVGSGVGAVWSSDEADPEEPVVDAPPDVPKKVGPPTETTIGGRFLAPRDLSTRRIGHGGTSDVFRVRDTFEDVDRALKLFNPANRQAAFSEALMLRNCQHPGIVSYIKLGEHGDQYFVVMDYVDGVNLRAYLDQRGPTLPSATASGIVEMVLEALAHVHPDDQRLHRLRTMSEERDLSKEEADEMLDLLNAGVIHRDIKPENVMIRPDGTVVLVDFGIATAAGRRTRELSGTPDYMAPDAGIGAWQPEDDIFSCGVVFYEMLTGNLPYSNDDGERVESPIHLCDRLAGVEKDFADVVMKACAPSRDLRFSSAREFQAALAAARS